ncbi:hypothetical protein GCM10025865_15130 [Paraoerskovia sediminicola]|uniref:Uncharacterized protein n=2 Tax=Paraoerskovia sediminicola TaxID=1138587 RepID=A0ABM8G2C4_9CELL|nr:hypothetical protein GCM10025865_15130 [Paraoerskovia sediminicola]
MSAPRANGSSSARSAASRFAAAGIFALATAFPLVGASTGTAGPNLTNFIAAARTQTNAVSATLAAATREVRSFTGELGTVVAGAVASASAATARADAALTTAAEAAASVDVFDGRATVEVEDAQVALEAASAELRYATDRIAESGRAVPTSLTELGHHIDFLRGPASSSR